MKTTLIVGAIAMSLAAGQAFAEGEGSGDPFRFQSDRQVTSGRPFVTETMAEGIPQPTGNTTQPSSFAQLEPVAGHDAVVQTAASAPRGFNSTNAAYAQARNATLYWAARGRKARHLEAGVAPPKG